MSRSKHYTGRDLLEIMRKSADSFDEWVSINKKKQTIKRELQIKKNIKRQTKQLRKASRIIAPGFRPTKKYDSYNTSIPADEKYIIENDCPANVLMPITREDIKAIMEKLPSGITYGLKAIKLLLNKSDESVEILPGIWFTKTYGRYLYGEVHIYGYEIRDNKIDFYESAILLF